MQVSQLRFGSRGWSLLLGGTCSSHFRKSSRAELFRCRCGAIVFAQPLLTSGLFSTL